ncbi:MAG TPA: hypothetical protein VFQ61_23600 [Polyangiaceae bacterium]|nr:hypothetical protein [Polyangiaceae bacterium]
MGTSNTHPGGEEMKSSVLDPLEALFSEREREITDRRQRDLAGLRTLVGAGVLVGLTSLGLYAAQFGSWGVFARVLSGGVLTCAAAALIGVVGGFLFGLPRPLVVEEHAGSEGPSSQENPGRAGYVLTTNLERISDISIKILIGLALTQLYRVPELLGRFSDWLGRNVPEHSEAGKVAVGAMGYALCLGFLSGYLWTRLVLSPAFRRADEQLQKTLQRLAAAERKVREAGARVESMEMCSESKLSAAEQSAKSRIEGAERAAETILSEARAKASAAEQAEKRRLETLNQTLRDMLHALHAPAGQRGFDRAIAVAQQYVDSYGVPDCSLFQVRCAAAYGRRATELPETYDDARGLALEAVRRAIDASPELGRYWLSMWFHPEHPHATPGEDWLQVFFDEGEFQNLIGRDPYVAPE